MMHEPLIHEVLLKCSVAHAFEVFIDHADSWWPKGHRKFAKSKLHHDSHVGGQLIERAANGDVYVVADVVACDPPHQITLDWHPGEITGPTRTVVTFSARGPHESRIRVIHWEGDANLGDAWEQRATLFNKGWAAVFAAIDSYVMQAELES